MCVSISSRVPPGDIKVVCRVSTHKPLLQVMSHKSDICRKFPFNQNCALRISSSPTWFWNCALGVQEAIQNIIALQKEENYPALSSKHIDTVMTLEISVARWKGLVPIQPDQYTTQIVQGKWGCWINRELFQSGLYKAPVSAFDWNKCTSRWKKGTNSQFNVVGLACTAALTDLSGYLFNGGLFVMVWPLGWVL